MGLLIILIVEITSQCICISKPQVAYLKYIQFHASVIPQQKWGTKENRQGNMGCNKDGLRIQMNPEDIMLSEIGQSQRTVQEPTHMVPQEQSNSQQQKALGLPGLGGGRHRDLVLHCKISVGKDEKILEIVAMVAQNVIYLHVRIKHLKQLKMGNFLLCIFYFNNSKKKVMLGAYFW